MDNEDRKTGVRATVIAFAFGAVVAISYPWIAVPSIHKLPLSDNRIAFYSTVAVILPAMLSITVLLILRTTHRRSSPFFSLICWILSIGVLLPMTFAEFVSLQILFQDYETGLGQSLVVWGLLVGGVSILLMLIALVVVHVIAEYREKQSASRIAETD